MASCSRVKRCCQRGKSVWYAQKVESNHAGLVFLLTSAGRRVELLRSVRAGFFHLSPTLIAIDASPLVPTRYEADKFYQVPRSDTGEFCQVFSGILRDHQVNFVIPTIDTELVLLAKLREEDVHLGTDILVSSSEAVRIAQDKLGFARFLESNDLPFIPTHLLVDQVEDCWEFPAFVKPRTGSSSKGSRLVKSPAEITATDFESDLIIQPFRGGEEFTVDFAVDGKGSLLGFSIRERLKVRAGEVIVSITREIGEIEELLRIFVERFRGLYGLLNLQVVLYQGRYEILELNARVGGGYPLTHAAGCDLLRAIVSGAATSDLRTREGFVMLRHDESMIIRPEEL